MNSNQYFTKNVQYLAEKQKRGLGEIERAAGVSAGYILRVTAGVNHPSLELIDVFAKVLNETASRLISTDIQIEELAAIREWIRITDDKPPCGKCLEVLTRDSSRGGKIEHKYPVWYIERPYEKGYSFFFGDTNNPLLPDYSEVVAWRYMHDDWERIDFND